MTGAALSKDAPAEEAPPSVEAALDLLPTAGVVERLLAAEDRVLPAVRAAVPAIARAAELIAERMAAGGRLVLLGAGTSGRLAVLEAAELPGTFGLSDGTVVGVTAGAGRSGLAGSDWDEDDTGAGQRDLLATGVGAGDVLIAVAASGRTPYTVAAAGRAAESGMAVVSVTTSSGSPLASLADVAVEVPMGAEALHGSTRLTAGTATKLTLDALTTAAMVRLGRVHDNLMIDVVPANAKLRERSAGQVAAITGAPPDAVRTALEACGWNARAAVVTLLTGLAAERAQQLAGTHPTLRAALAAVPDAPASAGPGASEAPPSLVAPVAALPALLSTGDAGPGAGTGALS
jgi:N-acetylmuramic acid 6-phosphate etherase